MTGFESQTSCIGSDRSTNWATTTAQLYEVLLLPFCTYLLCAYYLPIVCTCSYVPIVYLCTYPLCVCAYLPTYCVVCIYVHTYCE